MGVVRGISVTLLLSLLAIWVAVDGCARQDCPTESTSSETSQDLQFVTESKIDTNTGSKSQQAADDKVWLFAVDGRKRPYSFLDDRGQLVGFDVDLVAKVCQAASKTCKMVLAEFTECAFSSRNVNMPGRGLMAEWFDGCPSYTESVDRLGSFDFTDSYLATACSFTVLPGNPSKFNPKLTDYSNFTITYLTGAVSNAKCLARLRKTFGNLVVAKDLPDAKNILATKKADVLFSPRTVIPDLETLPDRVHCELGGAGVMTKKGSAVSAWWNPAFRGMVSSGQYEQFCREAGSKYQKTFKCLNATTPTSQPAPSPHAPVEKTWLFAVSGRRKPFNYMDDQGNLIGWDVDFIQAVCAVAGKKCSVVLSEFTECTFTNRNINYPGRGIMDGWFDACPGYSHSIDRENGFDFTDAYLKSYSTFTVIPGNPSGFDPDKSDFSKFTFTHLTGAYTNAACLKRLGKVAKNIVIAANLPDAKNILFSKQADVLFSPRGYIPDLETLPQRVHCELTGTSVMTKKGSPLVGWWNPAFETFTKQGGYRKLCQEGIKKYSFPIKCFD